MLLLIGALVYSSGSDFIGCLPGAYRPACSLVASLSSNSSLTDVVVVNLRGRGPPLPRLACDELLDKGTIGCAGGDLLLNRDCLLLGCLVVFVQLALQIQL